MNWKRLYFGAEGRINRKQWWISHLVQWIPLTAIVIIVSAFSTPDNSDPSSFLVFAIVVWCIALIWTSICLNAKCWHDRDKSEWWQLIGIVPLIGLWALIENGFLRGTEGPNQYGDDPLA